MTYVMIGLVVKRNKYQRQRSDQVHYYDMIYKNYI